jgi:uncharacterized phiE125 gp8 family phage protein
MSVFIRGWPMRGSGIPPHWASVPVTPPTLSVLSLTEAKDHARISGTDEDAQVQRWLETATEEVEHDTGLKLLTQTWDVTTTRFPSGRDSLSLPMGPLQAVTHLKYYDADAVLQTVSSTDYLVDVASLVGIIGLTDAGTWPTDLRFFQPVTIRVVVGWTAAHLVPRPLVQAVAELVAEHSEHRQGLPVDRSHYHALIGPYVTKLVA